MGLLEDVGACRLLWKSIVYCVSYTLISIYLDIYLYIYIDMQAHRILLGFLEVNHLANYPRTYQGWSIFPFNKQPVGFDGFFYGNSEVLRSKGPTLYVVCSPFLPLAPSLWTCRWCFSEGIWRMGKPWGWFMDGSRRLGKFHEISAKKSRPLEVSKKSSLSHPWMKWKRLKDSVFGMSCIFVGWNLDDQSFKVI